MKPVLSVVVAIDFLNGSKRASDRSQGTRRSPVNVKIGQANSDILWLLCCIKMGDIGTYCSYRFLT